MVKFDLTQLESIIKNILERMNFKFYDMQFNTVSRILKIFIDREQGNVTINDCENVSNAISQELDNLDLIDFHYTLEVSSPGVERHLVRPEHFQWALGKLSEITLKDLKIKGYIREASDSAVKIALNNGEIVIPFTDIIKAKIVEELDYGKRR